jgi:lipoprotein-releasing system ATP-binding protein
VVSGAASNGAADASAYALRAKGLAKIYPGVAGGDGEDERAAVRVFEGIDIDVRAGERLALTGESGAGKSTLLHLLGLLDAPSAGRIWYGGAEVSALDGAARADVRNREVGFVWQTNTLLVEFTALENAAMPLRIRGLGRRESEQRAAECLKEVGLASRLHHRPGELSGGEQQRVALARALAVEPRLLFADEPTGSLDAKTGERVMELIEQVHAQRRLAVVYVTHNLAFAERAERVMHLAMGRLEEVRRGRA